MRSHLEGSLSGWRRRRRDWGGRCGCADALLPRWGHAVHAQREASGHFHLVTLGQGVEGCPLPPP